MKKHLFYIGLFVSIFVSVTFSSLGQDVIYTENFGFPTAATLVQNYHGWQDQSVLYTGNGTCDIRSSSASSGYEYASGSGNVMINDTEKWFQVSKIRTLGWEDIVLRLGIRKTSQIDGSCLNVQVSSDSVNWTYLYLTELLPSGSGTSGWYYVEYVGSIPSCSNLHLKFSNSDNVDVRVDDISLTGTNINASINENELSLTIFPNPSSDFLHLNNGSCIIDQIQVMDAAGRVLFQKEVNNYSECVNISHLPKGMYYLKVLTGHQSTTSKFLKI